MDDGKGITEAFWSTKVSDDAKMLWRVGSRGVTFLAALLLPKTGLQVLDIVVAVLTALIPLLVIETHRAYSKFSPGFLARVIKVCVNGTSLALACLGLVVYAGVVAPVVSAMATLFFLEHVSSFDVQGQAPMVLIHYWLFAGATAFAVVYAVLNNFRELKIVELVYHLPRAQVERLMRARPLRASNWLEFAGFELCVLIASFFYTLMVSQAVVLLLDGFGQLLMLFK
jgi:hypothetical protein